MSEQEEDDDRARLENLCLSALTAAFQSERGRAGFAEDLRFAAGMCRATWGEEQIWHDLARVQRGKRKRTSLMYAAMTGDVKRVRWLLTCGAPTELMDVEGQSAVYHAAGHNQVAALRELIAAGADVNSQTNITRQYTPICIASEKGYTNVLQVLIAAGADVNARSSDDGTTPVLISIENGHFDIFRSLMVAGANIFETDDAGYSPFYVACQYGHSSIFSALLEAGADVNSSCDDETTPLYVASYYGHAAIVRALIDAGANVDKADEDGFTPLYRASEFGHTIACSH
jgi:ankyrin repeat protein